jgi:ABC-type polysaccharide/polyol phosphate export permease
MLSLASEFRDAVGQWRVWTLLAFYDVKGRYRRSLLGQFWIVISMAITVAALGLVYSVIFRLPISEYLIYISISYVIWMFLANMIQEASTTFIASEGYIKSSSHAILIHSFQMVARNSLILFHNMLIIPMVMLIFFRMPSWNALWFIPGLALVQFNAIIFSASVGIISLRFRDLPQIVASIVQLAFFLSPILWTIEQLPAEYRDYVYFNPFAIFLELMREPLQGQQPSSQLWMLASVLTILNLGFASLVFAKYRKRVAYYV